MATPPGAEAGSTGVFGRRPSTGLGASARAIAEDTSALVRAEIALAKAEIAEGARAKALGAGMLAGAAALSAVAFLALVVALGFVLAEVAGLPGWASALIVAGVLLLGAAVLVLIGRKQLATPVSIETTKTNVQEDVAWAKQSLGRS
jgi:hypothetical protein